MSARVLLAFTATALVGTLGHAAPSKKLALGDLPQASIPALPSMDGRPAGVPAGSVVRGLTVAGDPNGAARAEAQRASRHKRKMPPQPVTPGMMQAQVSGDSQDQACVAVLMQGRDVFRTTPLFVDASEGVLPMRVESLRESNDAPVLSIVDAWVDPATQGAQEIRRIEIPLKKVASGPLDAPVYAFRDGSVVHVVVPAGNNAQMTNADGGITPSSCSVARGELSAERGKGATLSGFFTRQTPAIEAKDGFAAVPPMSFRVTLAASSSQTSRDPDPVLSFVVRNLDPIPDMPRQRVATVDLRKKRRKQRKTRPVGARLGKLGPK